MSTLFKKGSGKEQVDELRALLHQAEQERQALTKLLTEARKPQEESTGVLRSLIAEAARERQALAQVVEEASAREERLTATENALTQLADRATDLTARLGALEGQARDLSEVDARVNRLVERVSQAEETATSTARNTLETVKEMETRLAPLTRVQELAGTMREEISNLNSLAEHVQQKVKLLETQKATVEHAVLESNRLSELVWKTDEQIKTLSQSSEDASRVEQVLVRVESLAKQSHEQLREMTQTEEALERNAVKLAEQLQAQAEMLRKQGEAATASRQELDAFGERIAALRAEVEAVERTVEDLSAKERDLAVLAQKTEAQSRQGAALAEQLDALHEKHVALQGLGEKLQAVDELARKTTWEMEGLQKGKAELDALRAAIQDLFGSHQEAAQLVDKLSVERTSLESFMDRVRQFRDDAPDLEQRIVNITAGLATVEQGDRSAQALLAMRDETAGALDRLQAHLEVVDRVDQRLSELHALTLDVDQKHQRQLARLAEIETLRSTCDGVAIQVADIERSLTLVAAAERKLRPLVEQVVALSDDVDKARRGLAAAAKEEEALADQERRLDTLLEGAGVVQEQVEARLKQVEALTVELGRGTAAKEELAGELAKISSRQLEVGTQMQAAEEHLKSLGRTVAGLEQRRAQLAAAEATISGFEVRLEGLARTSDDVDRKVDAIARRNGLVEAVRKEVAQIHQISAQSRADLQHVSDQRAALADLRAQLDEVLARTAETAEKIDLVESRRKAVELVEHEVRLITNMLEDVRLNLEMLTEQRAIIDHAMVSAAALDKSVQDAQATLRSLHSERELAERIGHGIKRLRDSRSAPAVDSDDA